MIAGLLLLALLVSTVHFVNRLAEDKPEDHTRVELTWV